VSAKSFPRILSVDEIREVLLALPLVERVFWALLTLAGVRPGEAVALRWEDIDFVFGEARVSRSYSTSHGLRMSSAKHGQRIAPLADPLLQLLSRNSSPHGWVLGGTGPRPSRSQRELLETSRRAWAMAGVPPINTADARWTCRWLMLAAGIPEAWVSLYLGIASPHRPGDFAGVRSRWTGLAEFSASLAGIFDEPPQTNARPQAPRRGRPSGLSKGGSAAWRYQ
jgi:integrase